MAIFKIICYIFIAINIYMFFAYIRQCFIDKKKLNRSGKSIDEINAMSEEQFRNWVKKNV